MTFLEKAMEIDKKKGINSSREELINYNCPSDYGMEDKGECNAKDRNDCTKCWNREMPDTEIKPKEDMDRQDYYNLGHNEGSNDVWECLKRATQYSYAEKLDIFGVPSLSKIVNNLTPQEALAKLKAYEDSKIEVGDVVEIMVDDERFFGVTLGFEEDKRVKGFLKDGRWFSTPFGTYKKTGQHFDIKSILEQIGE